MSRFERIMLWALIVNGLLNGALGWFSLIWGKP